MRAGRVPIHRNPGSSLNAAKDSGGQDAEDDADERASNGHGELLSPVFGHLRKLGNATEEPQFDGFDVEAVVHCYQLAELVALDTNRSALPLAPRGSGRGRRRRQN